MAITQNTYTGDGSTVLFSFTFPYLETTDIKVSVNGSITTAYSLANATTVQFNTAPVNGAAIRIYRQTDDAALNATFYAGSAIRSQDLNDNFTQNLYVTQESNRDATEAISTALAATATANNAATSAANAVTTANTASSTAASAASSAAAAVSTANTAASDAAAAVSTANSAASDASNALTQAAAAAADATSAISTANGAVTTANAASSTASTALSTANSAATSAATAISTANAASSTASSAVSTANTASSNASSALSTASAADTKADQAIAAVSNALLFTIVSNVASIPASPVDGDAIEVTNSTGIESFTPLSGIPAGFVGDSGLGVRILYDGVNSTWNWLQYFPIDPDSRYAGPNTAAGTVSAPSIAFGPSDPNTGIFSPGADELAFVTGGVARLTFDSAGAATFSNSVSLPAGSTVPGYLDTATAASTYQTQAGMSSYVATTDIGVTVQGYDASILKSADIGVSVQGYDATTLKSADIGVTVQGYDATTLKSADIGVSVQAYDADTAKLDVAQTFTAQQTFGELKETVYTLSGTAIDPANGSIQTKTLSANTTFTDALEAGQTVVLMLENGASYTVTWPTITWVTSGGNVAPTLTAKDTLVLWKVSTTLYGAYVGSYV